MESLLKPPIGFAHRGAPGDGRDNTIGAFRQALADGATGLESDVWVTADGVAVLDHDGVVRSGLRRVPIASLPRAKLPEHIPALADLYAACGSAFQLSLDVKDEAAARAAVAVARAAGAGAAGRLWLCYHDWEAMSAWRADRAVPEEVRLIDSTRLRRIKEGPERRAASLADAGVDGVNMHLTDWTPGLTTLFHRFRRLAFGWDAQFDRNLLSLLRMGCDAVYSDHVDRMVAALQQVQGGGLTVAE